MAHRHTDSTHQLDQGLVDATGYQTYDQRLVALHSQKQSQIDDLGCHPATRSSGLRGGHAPQSAAPPPPPTNQAQFFPPPFATAPAHTSAPAAATYPAPNSRAQVPTFQHHAPTISPPILQRKSGHRRDSFWEDDRDSDRTRKTTSIGPHRGSRHGRQLSSRHAGQSPPRLLSNKKAHELHDHIVNLLKSRDFTMVLLAIVQHSLLLVLKGLPGHASRLSNRGGRPLNVIKLSGMIDAYRCFHNISSWINVYETFKSGHSGHLGKDPAMRGLAWTYHFAYVGYLFFEGLNFMGMADVLKMSRDSPMRHALRLTRISRWSIRFWLASTIITYIKNAREAYLDRKKKRSRLEKEQRRGTRKKSARDGVSKDSSFWKDMRIREIKRRRQTWFDGFWFPGALHLSLKNSPLKDNSIVSLSAILAYGNKMRYLWKDSKPPVKVIKAH